MAGAGELAAEETLAQRPDFRFHGREGVDQVRVVKKDLVRLLKVRGRLQVSEKPPDELRLLEVLHVLQRRRALDPDVPRDLRYVDLEGNHLRKHLQQSLHLPGVPDLQPPMGGQLSIDNVVDHSLDLVLIDTLLLKVKRIIARLQVILEMLKRLHVLADLRAEPGRLCQQIVQGDRIQPGSGYEP